MKHEEEIRIKIQSELYEVEASLFSDEDGQEDEHSFLDLDAAPDAESNLLQINSLGTLIDDGDRISISYNETEATGMDGSVTTVTFLKNADGIVTMIREGVVSTTLVFEDGKRHHCIYNTPFMPFEVCVHTLNVNNSLQKDGTLDLDYIVEIRGAKAERTKFNMQILK